MVTHPMRSIYTSLIKVACVENTLQIGARSGNSMADSGISMADSGISMADSGISGISMADSGISMADSGISMTDSGISGISMADNVNNREQFCLCMICFGWNE